MMSAPKEPDLRDVPCPLCGGSRGKATLVDASTGRLERAALVAWSGDEPGVFPDIAAAHGWWEAGVEPSRGEARLARRKGHRVHAGTLESAALAQKSFAVLTMWDTLEHYTDPVKELRHARELARDDGYLVLSTVNVDSWFVRLLGKRWPWYMRMHLSYFTPRTLARALELAGWRLVHLHGYAHVVT